MDKVDREFLGDHTKKSDRSDNRSKKAEKRP